MSEQIYDLDAIRAEKHAKIAEDFGSKPFKFGGEIFYVRANVGYAGLKRVASLTADSAGGETFSAIEASILTMIDPKEDSHARMSAVFTKDDDPVTFDDLLELQNWLIGETSGRPPTQPEPSSDTPSAPGTPLTAVSSTGPGEAPGN